MERIDESALNTLLLDDQVEPATAYVASIEEKPQPASRQLVGIIGTAIAVALAYWVLT